MITCKYCHSDKLVKRRVEPHIGIYCVACSRWQQWVSQGSPKERAVPWELTGKSSKVIIIDNVVDAINYACGMNKEQYETMIKARFPTNAKLIEAHSDPDNKPPWED